MGESGFLHDVPVTCTSTKVERAWVLVRKMIRSGATTRKTQRRETHRACRRRRELRNDVRRQEKRVLYFPPYFPHSTCLASYRRTPKRGRNCCSSTAHNQNISASHANAVTSVTIFDTFIYGLSTLTCLLSAPLSSLCRITIHTRIHTYVYTYT